MCVKKIFMMLTLAMLAQFGWGQEVSYQLSSHILDINKGAPAADVKSSGCGCKDSPVKVGD